MLSEFDAELIQLETKMLTEILTEGGDEWLLGIREFCDYLVKLDEPQLQDVARFAVIGMARVLESAVGTNPG